MRYPTTLKIGHPTLLTNLENQIYFLIISYFKIFYYICFMFHLNNKIMEMHELMQKGIEDTLRTLTYPNTNRSIFLLTDQGMKSNPADESSHFNWIIKRNPTADSAAYGLTDEDVYTMDDKLTDAIGEIPTKETSFQLKYQQGGIRLYTTEHQDTLLIQHTDYTVKITLTYSGMY